MYFLLSVAAFAVLVLAFNLLVLRSRANPNLFAGEWLAVSASVAFTGAFAGAFGAMIATVNAVAPNLFVGLAVTIATAVVIVAVIGYLMKRHRAPAPGATLHG